MDLNVDLLGGGTFFGRMTVEERVRARLPRAQRLSNRPDWFRITNSADGSPARLDIYDEIGFWAVNAADFGTALSDVKGDRLSVHVNSPGGDVFDGIAILNLLRGHPAAVDVVVDGLAASAASVIAMAGDTVTMMPGSQMMIHDVSALCIGNAKDMADSAKLLDQISDNLAGIYASCAGGDAADWRKVMRGEAWYTAEEAVAAGLAHTVGVAAGKKPANPEQVWNLSFYSFNAREQAPAPRIVGADADDTSWDGGAAMSAAASADDPAAAYKAICAGRKEGDPSKQSSWALPHHKHPGDAPNAAGVRNALARLPQTQGLTNEAAAKAHLQAHMNAVSSDGTAAADQFDPETVRAALRSAFASKEGAAT